MSDQQSVGPENSANLEAQRLETLSVSQALDLAKQLHRSGELDAAGLLYYRILEAAPATVEALHFAGLLQHQRGQADEALGLIRRSIEIEPGQAGWHNNLGSVLIEQGRPGEAIDAFQAAITLDPASAECHNNLAVALRLVDRPADAEASYRRAIATNPAYQDAYDNLGRLLVARGRVREAISFHAKARELDPRNERTRRFLVAAYGASGESDNALKVLDEWLAEEPGNEIARHMRASVSGEGVPERASDAYVEALFDRFASSFDVQLAKLGYRAPALAAEALASACGDPRGDLEICDAGCGTGLCGPLLKPFAGTLIGVDLSDRMLEKAKARACYDALEKAELTQFLLANPQHFDAVVSADTLCYFGPLGPVLAAAAGALRPGGWLVFSVEQTTDPAGFRLNPHGRYSHHPDHVADALVGAGFEIAGMRSDTLRDEAGEAVSGMIVTARKPARTLPEAFPGGSV